MVISFHDVDLAWNILDKSRTTYRSKSPRYPSNEIAYHNATKITKKKYPVIMQQNHDEAQSWELSMISITNLKMAN